MKDFIKALGGGLTVLAGIFLVMVTIAAAIRVGLWILAL